MVDGVDAVFFYLVAYGAMTIGAFGVLQYLSTSGQPAETVDDLAGLSRTRPGMALLMVLFLFSLIGIPLTAGFMGKFLLFVGRWTYRRTVDVAASLEQRRLFITLALLAALNAAIGGWYYLRIAAVMYLREPPPSAATLAAKGQRSWPVLAAVWLCAVLTLGIGVYPAPLKEAVQAAVPRLSERRCRKWPSSPRRRQEMFSRMPPPPKKTEPVPIARPSLASLRSWFSMCVRTTASRLLGQVPATRLPERGERQLIKSVPLRLVKSRASV